MMTRHAKRPDSFYERTVRMLMVYAGLTVLVLSAGCASPPSVLPLLAVTEQALVAEAERLTEDAERDQLWLEQTRDALERAYDADLAEQAELDSQWVRSATSGYVLAREALVRHELELAEQRRTRGENLHAAAEATRRAGAILQQRDKLTDRMIGERVWNLLDPMRER